MKNIYLLLILLLSSAAYAAYDEASLCKELDVKFEQADYLIKTFNDHRGAYTVVKHSPINYRQNGTRNASLQCLDTYKDRWIYLLYKNDQFGSLEQLFRQDETNPLLARYLGDISKKHKRSEQALTYYRQYVTLTKKPDPKVLEYIKSGGLIAYKSKWAKHLNPGGDIPTGKFKNIFFDTKTKKVFKTTYSDTIDIRANIKIFGQNTIDAASYHVGYFKVEQETPYTILLRAGAKACRVVVDGRLLTEQTRYQKPYTFSKGVHKIEIEYLNRNYFYDLHFSMTPHQKRYSNDELKQRFANQNYDVWVINYQPLRKGTNSGGSVNYEPGARTPEITLKNSAKPVLLILQSSGKVEWRLKNTRNVKAIVVGSHNESLDSVKTDRKHTIYHAERSFKAADYKAANHRCIGSILVGGSPFLRLNDDVSKLFGRPVLAYTYSRKQRFEAPQEIIDPKEVRQMQVTYDQAKQECGQSKLGKAINKKGGK